jgi:lipopolysaccharide/colanic/teichoic acid biosynthesis glycosyltransferase/NDP-sugar pyrophosphorylase family protein
VKALIVDGEWKSARRFTPLRKCYPICAFPVLNEPIIEHNIELLHRKGITDVVVAFSERTAAVDLERISERRKGKNKIHFYQETKPKGTAGILGNFASLLGNQPFLVMNSNLYVEDFDLEGLIAFHERKRAVVTVGVKRQVKRIFNIEAIKISREGLLKEVHIMHHSMDRRSPWVTSGIYLLTPAVFDFIDGQRYLDIKEQLIPLLQTASLPVYAYEVKGYYRDICSLEDYFVLHRDLLETNNRVIRFQNKKEIAEDVWVGDDTVVSASAYMKGPIVLGKGCHIADHAQIIGPTVMGDECRVAEDTIVRESVFWRNVSLEKGARSEFCILGESSRIREGRRLKNLVVVDSLRIGDINLISQERNLTGIVGSNLSRVLVAKIHKRIFDVVKRTMDVFIAFALILVLLPVYVLVALAMKLGLGGRGPVLFVQKRCGKNGKMFNMLKFRTMVSSAEEMQAELASQKDSDGPMFKMARDPRVTRMGKVLRRTSLDELPQLINVLKGEMSMVGPRPLIMDEMKFSPSWRDVRLRVKPGITGLWQVQGRSDAPFHDWIRYDVEYVMSQSLWMDMKILFKTAKVVLLRIGAR